MASRITRRRLLGAAGAAAGVGLLGAAGGLRLLSSRIPARLRKPSNVVLIVSDAFRADRLSALRNGASLTPSLDSLAAGGLVFDNCYSPSSWTKTSMASIFTGTHPAYHGVYTGIDALPKGCDTIPEMMRRAGYGTHAIQTNLWLAPEAPNLQTHGVPVKDFGFRRGFDRYLYLDAQGDDKQLDMPAYAGADEVNMMVEYVLGRIGRPYFLYVHYMETHQPWVGTAPREFTGEYASDRRGRSAAAVFDDDRKLLAKVFKASRDEISPEEARRVPEIYDEAVRYVDAMIGRAIETIVKSDSADDTLFIFTADHGDELWEHGRLGHAYTLYEEVERVPLIIRAPGVKPGRVSARVSNVNIYETLRALCAPSDAVREAVGAPLVDGSGRAPSADELIFAELHSLQAGENWKLSKVVRPDGEEAILKEADDGGALGVERYSLPSDPYEKSPLPASDADAFVRQVGEVKRSLRSLASLHGVKYVTTDSRWQNDFGRPGENAAAEAAMTDEEKRRREQLRALGYLQ